MSTRWRFAVLFSALLAVQTYVLVKLDSLGSFSALSNQHDSYEDKKRIVLRNISIDDYVVHNRANPPRLDLRRFSMKQYPVVQDIDLLKIARTTIDRKWVSGISDYYVRSINYLDHASHSCYNYTTNTLHYENHYPLNVNYTMDKYGMKLKYGFPLRHSYPVGDRRFHMIAYILMSDDEGVKSSWDFLFPDVSADIVSKHVRESFAWMMHIFGVFTMYTLYKQPQNVYTNTTLLDKDIVHFARLAVSVLSHSYSRKLTEVPREVASFCSGKLYIVPIARHRFLMSPQWVSLNLLRQLVYLVLRVPIVIHSPDGRFVTFDSSHEWLKEFGNSVLIERMMGLMKEESLNIKNLCILCGDIKSIIIGLSSTDVLIASLNKSLMYAVFMRPGASVIALYPSHSATHIPYISDMYPHHENISHSFPRSLVMDPSLMGAFVEMIRKSFLHTLYIPALPFFMYVSEVGMYDSHQSKKHEYPICQLEKSQNWLKYQNSSDLFIHCCAWRSIIDNAIEMAHVSYPMF